MKDTVDIARLTPWLERMTPAAPCFFASAMSSTHPRPLTRTGRPGAIFWTQAMSPQLRLAGECGSRVQLEF